MGYGKDNHVSINLLILMITFACLVNTLIVKIKWWEIAGLMAKPTWNIKRSRQALFHISVKALSSKSPDPLPAGQTIYYMSLAYSLSQHFLFIFTGAVK